MKVKVKRFLKPLKTAEPVYITTDFIKLDAFLKFAVIVSSGGEAKMIIGDGLVTVNGEVCKERGRKLYPGDLVELDSRSYIVSKEESNDGK